ncbi:MAG: hypothetical protein HN348_21015 [Proteobacteria bacterium]|jgi:23S rRNA (guanine2445-N2)-methyltransferase / 23S rRNA (guanine2069-N7)-methyltransferase|nr:hypothetical protein [Pseudomonadota bacterium]
MNTHEFVATSTRGVEKVLAQELTTLGVDTMTEERGAIRFSASLATAYRVCLWSRIASRVLLVLQSFPAPDADALYDGVRAIAWSDHLSHRQTLAVDFVGASPTIRNSRFGALKAKDAIVDSIRHHGGARPNVDLRHPDVRVNVYLARDVATVSIDLSGPPLHHRGYGRQGLESPLKENLAAALLWMVDWPALAKDETPLLDPMCGSGSFLIEAAGIALDIAAGTDRTRWGFDQWLGHDRELWQELRNEAKQRRKASRKRKVQISGSDVHPGTVDAARLNARRAKVDAVVDIEVRGFDTVEPLVQGNKPPCGLLVTNPPYGLRSGQEQELGALYSSIGDRLRHLFLGWKAGILVGEPSLAKRIGLKADRRHVVHNGPIECRFLLYTISSNPVVGRGPGWR